MCFLNKMINIISRLILILSLLAIAGMCILIVVRYPCNHGAGSLVFLSVFIILIFISLSFIKQTNEFAFISLIISCIGVVFSFFCDYWNIMLDYDVWLDRNMPEWGESKKLYKEEEELDKYFFNLPKIQSSKWKKNILVDCTKKSKGIIPFKWKVIGYAKFDVSELKCLLSHFNDFRKEQVKVDFPYLQKAEMYSWKKSPTLIEKIKPKDITGSIWVCEENGLIYFELEEE